MEPAAALQTAKAGGLLVAPGIRPLLATQRKLSGTQTATHLLPRVRAGQRFTLSVALDDPVSVPARAQLTVTVEDSAGLISSKKLHQAEGGFYLSLVAREEGKLTIRVAAENAPTPVGYQLQLLEWLPSGPAAVTVEVEPNDTPDQATPAILGQPVFGSADEQGSYPRPVDGLGGVFDQATDWYRYQQTAAQSRLVFFECDIDNRDQIPPSVEVFTLRGGEPTPYLRGQRPTSSTDDGRIRAGDKFVTRLLAPGVYYVRVRANHPFYVLRTRSLAPPPYADPQEAARVGMDYLLGAGDSWAGNTPRGGGRLSRITPLKVETRQCMACHAVQFPARAALTGLRNGYAPVMRSQLQYLAERLKSGPKPFPGHPTASWTGAKGTPIASLARSGALSADYEELLATGQPSRSLPGIANYLALAYGGREGLPTENGDGGRAAGSPLESGFYAWRIWDRLAQENPGDGQTARRRDELRDTLAAAIPGDVQDLCWQTVALCVIDRTRFAEQIGRNRDRLIDLQRPDGQWPLQFEGARATEAQTGLALYTLAHCGAGMEQPAVRKGVEFLLRRQRDFGGWQDPQSGAGTDQTSFRETQFAVMALTQLFPEARRGDRGWGVPLPEKLDTSHPARLLEDLDRVWARPGKELLRVIHAAAQHPEPMVRAAAIRALGRSGAGAKSAGVVVGRLGDPHAGVRDAAAWAARRLGAWSAAGRALAQGDGRTRRGASRVFSQQFALGVMHDLVDARRPVLAGLLAGEAAADPVLQVQSLQALTEYWFWTRDLSARERIEDRFIRRLALPENAWTRRNRIAALNQICDQNVGALEEYWIPVLATEERRSLATEAYQATAHRLATKLAGALQRGNDLQQEGLLRALTDFRLGQTSNGWDGKHPRLGTDDEPVEFYAESAATLSNALIPLMTERLVDIRRLAVVATYSLRGIPMQTLPLRARGRALDPDSAVRRTALEFAPRLAVKITDANRVLYRKLVADLLRSRYPEAWRLALGDLRLRGEELGGIEEFAPAVRRMALGGEGAVLAEALRALAMFPELATEVRVGLAIRRGLASPDSVVAAAAAETALRRPAFINSGPARRALGRLLRNELVEVRLALLQMVGENPAIHEDVRVVDLVARSMRHSDPTVRRQALEVVQRSPYLAVIPAVAEAVQGLRRDLDDEIGRMLRQGFSGQD